MDDIIETMFLSLIYEGRFHSFKPVTYLDRMDLTLIRPLIYAPEKDIKYFINHSDLPVLSSACPADKTTDRENIKKLLNELERENKGLKYRIFGAMQRAHIDGYGPVGPASVRLPDSRMAGISSGASLPSAA